MTDEEFAALLGLQLAVTQYGKNPSAQNRQEAAVAARAFGEMLDPAPAAPVTPADVARVRKNLKNWVQELMKDD